MELHQAQASFLDSDALYRGFVGGRGAGKSFIGAYDMLRRAKPKRLYCVIAPTYPMLKDVCWRTFTDLGRRLNFVGSINRSDLRVTLGNGSEVIFRSGDEPDRLRGPNLSGVWLDEASIMERGVFDICIASLREGGEQGWLSATFTPKGKGHWTYERFGLAQENTQLIRAKTVDNPFLPTEFAATLRQQYTSAMAAQELSGEFVDMEGALFRRQWFTITEAAPADCRKMRYWDLAATEATKGRDPDYTAGALVGEKDGVYYVLDIRHLRGTPMQVEALIHQTAEVDGRSVHIWMEQEPGSSGVNTIDHYTRRVLQGFVFHGNRATGSKAERAMPLASQAEASNVRIMRAAWNGALLDELESFPQGAHDDMVDACAGAFEKLARRSIPFGFIPNSAVANA